MIDREKVLAVLQKRFPGSTLGPAGGRGQRHRRPRRRVGGCDRAGAGAGLSLLGAVRGDLLSGGSAPAGARVPDSDEAAGRFVSLAETRQLEARRDANVPTARHLPGDEPIGFRWAFSVGTEFAISMVHGPHRFEAWPVVWKHACKRNDLAAREDRAYDTSHTHRGRSAHETADRDDLLFSILPDPESTGRVFRAADQLRQTIDGGPGTGPPTRRLPGPPEGVP